MGADAPRSHRGGWRWARFWERSPVSRCGHRRRRHGTDAWHGQRSHPPVPDVLSRTRRRQSAARLATQLHLAGGCPSRRGECVPRRHDRPRGEPPQRRNVGDRSPVHPRDGRDRPCGVSRRRRSRDPVPVGARLGRSQLRAAAHGNRRTDRVAYNMRARALGGTGRAYTRRTCAAYPLGLFRRHDAYDDWAGPFMGRGYTCALFGNPRRDPHESRGARRPACAMAGIAECARPRRTTGAQRLARR